MLKQHARLATNALYLADMTATALSFPAAYYLRDTFLKRFLPGGLYPLHEYYWLLAVIVPVWSLLLYKLNAYSSHRTTPVLVELWAVSRAVMLGGTALAAVAFSLRSYYISRALIVAFIAVNLLAIAAERTVIRLLSWFFRRRGYNSRNVLIVGTGRQASDMAKRIEKYRHWGFRIMGVVRENGEPYPVHTMDGHPIIGSLSDLEAVVSLGAVDEVIFAGSGRIEDYEDVFLMLEDNGINSRVVANMFPHVIAKLQLEELESVPLLTFTTVPTNTYALLGKRFFDVCAAVLLLILTSPVMLLTAALIKLTSPGPVLFRQKRSGLYGRTFTLYKFRSMYRDAEKKKKELEALNEMDGPVFKIRNDPRITTWGRFIRKASIDELPQVWNVLRGDMSIVGPRPPLPDEVARYDRWQRRRLSMRPGLTCLWQISGRNRVRKFDDWVKMDLQYIDAWSLGLDMKIFLKTIPAVLFRKGAA